MKLDIGGNETFAVSKQQLWDALNDPDVLTRCIPGCKQMTEVAPDSYTVEMQLRVAAVGGSFEGAIALTDKVPPTTCNITVSGQGTLGNGKGEAKFDIVELDAGNVRLDYQGEGEIGGLVAGVGQRILKSVSKNLIGRFFKALHKELDQKADSGAAA